jgi:hypothetical protein
VHTPEAKQAIEQLAKDAKDLNAIAGDFRKLRNTQNNQEEAARLRSTMANAEGL